MLIFESSADDIIILEGGDKTYEKGHHGTYKHIGRTPDIKKISSFTHAINAFALARDDPLWSPLFYLPAFFC